MRPVLHSITVPCPVCDRGIQGTVLRGVVQRAVRLRHHKRTMPGTKRRARCSGSGQSVLVVQVTSSDQATKANGQHTKPCGDCPWARAAAPGWLGGTSADEWIRAAHGEARIECHTMKGAQCAGAATYRANVCKRTRDPEDLVLPQDKARVFASRAEFLAHHGDD